MTLQGFGSLLKQPAVRALAAASGETECHLVGGVLRDHALGLPVHDVDAVVAGRGLEIAEILAEELPARLVLLGGKEFAAFRLVAADVTVDLWDRESMSLRDDLARRDFTVNAFALDLRTGEIADPFGGLQDLENQVLRATTEESFTGDPLRVLRLPRMLMRLPGFQETPETLDLARRSAPQLRDVAAERVRDELTYLFDHPRAHQGLAMLKALNVYPGLWLGRPGEPVPVPLVELEIENLPDRVRDLRALDPGLADQVEPRIARFATAFTHVPVRAGRQPADVLASFRDAGYVTRSTAADVAVLLPLVQMPFEDRDRRRFLYRTGRLWTTAACWLGAGDLKPGPWRKELALLVDLVRKEGENLFDPPRLLTGEEVQELLGIPPGPAVGKALDTVRRAQVDGQVRTREQALAMLSTLQRPR